EARASRLEAQHAAAGREREAVGPSRSLEIEQAQGSLEAAQSALASARAEVEAAEADRADRARAESDARSVARAAEDRLGRAQTEARGLAQLL
ncbi:hypothetical protein V3474_29255, partial [Pseudomonas aeruginosa]|uniref:hypothetical protein n=1 Tax=Pseudomonas aeruginosa TaxID=287 RepID=UPI002F948E72